MSIIKNIILDSPADALENIISPFIKEQFPSFLQQDNHKLVLFIKSYYEWLEKQGNAGYVLSKLDTVGDIDNNAEEFYEHFKNTYMESFPEILATNIAGETPNKKTLLKKIREFYGNKGTESAYKFLFRLLYDSDLEIYYPKEDILKVSDGVWLEPKSVKTTSSTGSDIFKTKGGILTQYSATDSTVVIASAFIDDVVRYSFDGLPITEFFLKNISGVFLPNLNVIAKIGDVSYTENSYSVLGEFFIETSGTGYSVGDVLFIVSDGVGFSAKVGVTGLAGSIKRISIENSGVNYFSEVEAIIVSSTGNNTTSRIFLRPTAITNYPGYFYTNKGKVSSNKKIQDGYYYQEFSYVLGSSISFDRYFAILKTLTHPAGMKMFGEILMQSNLAVATKPISEFVIYNTPIIGEYSPYRLETVLDLRNNNGNIDLYPIGYNPYISSPTVIINGVSSPVGTQFVGISGGYTYATVNEEGSVVHAPLGVALGSSAAWISGNEQSSNIAGLSGMILWLKPENIVAIGGGSAAGASLGVWTDASPEQNHGVLPTWDRWNDTLLYARRTSNGPTNNGVWSSSPVDNVEFKVGNYSNPISGISSATHGNLVFVGLQKTIAPTTIPYAGISYAWYSYTDDGTGVADALMYISGAITGAGTFVKDTVFGISYDSVAGTIKWYMDGVVKKTESGVPAGPYYPVITHGSTTGSAVEIIKAQQNGIVVTSSTWTALANGFAISTPPGATIEFLAPTIVKNDTATGRDGVRFNGQLIRSPYMLWDGPTGTVNTLRSNPELNFISGSSAEGILKGTHFYLTRGLSLSEDMDAFVVCRSDVDSSYQGRWFVGSHRKFQGNTHDIVFGNASYNASDRTASIANNPSYYRSAIISNVSGATAFAYDGEDGLVSFRPRGLNSTGINKVLAYDPHVSLFHVGTSIGEWSRDENFTIESFFNGDASRNYSPSTGRYVSTVTSPYKIEQPGFTSDHLLEIGRFGTAPRDGTGTLAGKNWLAETLTYQGDGSGATAFAFVGEVTNYAQKYQGKRTYRIKTGTSGNLYLQSNNDFSTITGYNTPSKDWTVSAYLKREDGGVISTAGGYIGGPTLGSPFYQGNATVTSVGGNWYHLKRSLVGQTLSGLYPNGVTLELVGFYGLSAGYTYDVSGAVVEKYPVYAPVGSTAWNESVNADTPYGFNGIINEIVVFNRKLKENERQTVYGYLSKKYSLSDALPNLFSLSHPEAQRVGDQFWEIKHHPNTTSLTSVILHSSVDTLVKPSLWTVGTGSVSGFSSSLNGPVGESVRLLDYDPWGKTSVVWQAQSDGADMVPGLIFPGIDTLHDGGWNGVNFSIDRTKLYRFSVWSKVVRNTDAVIYQGLGGNPILIAGSGVAIGSVDTNPYFSGRNTGNYPLNEWVLEVGFVYPNTYGVTGAVHPDSGAYTISRGANSKLFSDFYGQHKWSPTQTTALQRVYLFYENSAPPTSIIQFSEPRVEVVDGTEPSIADLLKDHPVENRIIPRGINFGNISIGDFINSPTATYRSIGYEQANGVGLTLDTYTGL
jgi:hypothetical protein